MARGNGGIIGTTNQTSFGNCTVTSKTSSGTLTTQPGTRVVQAITVAGGGGGGAMNPTSGGGGAGGAGGYRDVETNVCGATPYSITVGAGGAAGVWSLKSQFSAQKQGTWPE